MDESIETIRLKLTRKPKIAESPETSVTSTATTTPRIKVAHEPPQKTKKAPEKATRPKNWSPITDGKKAIISLIDQIWRVPYAPCQYVVQFICTVSLFLLQRHKYCVRWQNGRKSAMFYVNIDETETNCSVWISFPGETKPHPPHTSTAHFHRFLQRNLF